MKKPEFLAQVQAAGALSSSEDAERWARAVLTVLIDLAPDSIAAGQAMARFRVAPQAGDTAWLFDEGATDAQSDDRWVGLAVQSATSATGRCAGSLLVDSVLDAGRQSWRLTLSGSGPPATAHAGAPVRLTRMAVQLMCRTR